MGQIRQKPSRDDRQMLAFMLVIACYLVVALALPLYAILSKSFKNKDGEFIGLGNYIEYFNTPALTYSIQNSLTISLITTVISVSIAFTLAYGLHRSCMRLKPMFKVIALVPILVPSLLPGIALVYLFGKQGLIKGLMFGHDIYGPIGIVIAEVFLRYLMH